MGKILSKRILKIQNSKYNCILKRKIGYFYQIFWKYKIKYCFQNTNLKVPFSNSFVSLACMLNS